MNLSKYGKVTRLANAAASGSTDVVGSSLDMKGFQAVTFVCLLGSVSDSPQGTPTLKAQQAATDGSPETFADLAGTGVAGGSTDDNKVIILEVDSPRERYVRPVLTRTGGAALDGIIAIQTKAIEEPVTHDSTVAASEYHLAPSEGTA